MGKTTLVLILVASAVLPSPSIISAKAQEPKTDVMFRRTPIWVVIEELAASMHKSAAYDIGFDRRRLIDFEVSGVTRAQALAQLVNRERLLVVDVAGVLIVAPDTSATRYNYSAARVAACRITSEETHGNDVVYYHTTLSKILRTLSQSLSLEVDLDASITEDKRPYDLTLRNVTRADAIQVVSLAGHLEVREEGARLIFSTDTQSPQSR
jgi:hypothetical protein